MKTRLLNLIIFCLTIGTLTSCNYNACHHQTQKDCYYSNYYQSETIYNNRDYYHSDPIR